MQLTELPLDDGIPRHSDGEIQTDLDSSVSTDPETSAQVEAGWAVMVGFSGVRDARKRQFVEPAPR